ncbi:MAG: hypothetical protein KJZ86_26450 [Caldilineaceae bacterium]|nr:hypothetical protein [Caldilineaceae bacterium]
MADMEPNENECLHNKIEEQVEPVLDILEIRAARGSREKYLAALAQVPDVEPDEWDKITPIP